MPPYEQTQCTWSRGTHPWNHVANVLCKCHPILTKLAASGLGPVSAVAQPIRVWSNGNVGEGTHSQLHMFKRLATNFEDVLDLSGTSLRAM